MGAVREDLPVGGEREGEADAIGIGGKHHREGGHARGQGNGKQGK